MLLDSYILGWAVLRIWNGATFEFKIHGNQIPNKIFKITLFMFEHDENNKSIYRIQFNDPRIDETNISEKRLMIVFHLILIVLIQFTRMK